MISVYEGVLGGGKSYHAVIHVLDYLRRGGRVYTNIELVRGECEKFVADRFGVILDWDNQVYPLSPDAIKKMHLEVVGGTKDSPTLVVVDELHLYHNARDWAQSDRDLLSWLTQSRKLFVDIIFIVQHRNNVDKQWLRLTAGFYRGRDLRRWVIPVLGFRWPFNQFLWCCFDQDGKTLVRRDFEGIDSRIFRCYSSEQIFAGIGKNAGAGLGRVSLKKKEGGKMRKLGLVALICVIIGSVFLGRKAYAKLNPKPVEAKASSLSPMRMLSAPRPSDEITPTDIVAIEPVSLCWGSDGTFQYAVVNGTKTIIPPARDRNGEWVYYVQYQELDEDSKRMFKLMKDAMKLPPAPPAQTNRVPKTPLDNMRPPMPLG